ncbi:hypothetical protein B5M42_000105 [Paenibacillus athensensis]|uniref:ATP-grasp domain-containing protein n=1 Tax=Paenibacillus athensensis TaxID=1967502 RepID=A0A4Y8PT88_9BACL|nr:hypothetical protein [Paenibacillus athensensis]MCD1257236.1 hypothetical protein [Paenibacillus athensensis]
MNSRRASSLVAGSFDAEQFWREPGASQLPSMPDKERAFIIGAMDELLFALCSEGDALLVRYGLPVAQHAYLYRLGYRFEANRAPLTEAALTPSSPRSVFALGLEAEAAPAVERLSPQGRRLSAYAVIPQLAEFADRYGLAHNAPSYEAVRAVNSKIYSHHMYERLGLISPGVVAESAEELQRIGERLLAEGPFLIKDPFGVSGKGNMLVSAPPLLQRVVKHLLAQEQQGRSSRFLLEPLLEKETDFSCQFRIDDDGRWSLLSVQTMVNDAFAYLGSAQAGPELMTVLEQAGYFTLMERIAGELFKDGYRGNVCVDSMRLTDGALVPIVEINARQSMGLINAGLDRYLSDFGLTGSLISLSLGYERRFDYAAWLAELEREELLFLPGRSSGLIPLAANALCLAAQLAEAPQAAGKLFKGRSYVCIAARHAEERLQLLGRYRQFLQSRRFAIYN